MSFQQRFSNGWAIIKQSLSILQADKEIALYPILAGIITVGTGICLGIIFVLGYIGTWIFAKDFLALYGIATALIWAIISIGIAYLSEAAVITAAMIRIKGGDPTFSDGVKGTVKKIFPLLTWAVINAIITIVIEQLIKIARKKSKGVGLAMAVPASIFNFAWKWLTLFVIPVILFEDKSIFESIKRSKELFMKAWGESFIGYSVGGIFFLLGLIAVPVIVLAAISQSFWLIVGSIALSIIYWTILVILGTSAIGIAKAALYYYATTGKIPAIYTKETITSLRSTV